ncbi:hypothetical protein ACTQ3Z_02910 [Lawsonibacter sp. LCP25S3_F5]
MGLDEKSMAFQGRFCQEAAFFSEPLSRERRGIFAGFLSLS